MNDTADKPAAADVEIDRRRYPGVRPFQEPDSPRFFGRHRATEELLLRVLSVRLLLQFAPSGAGKTSLLNAGLCPQLRPHGYLPCNVRLNQPQESLLEAVHRSLREAARSAKLKDPLIPESAASVWDLLAGTQLWSSELLLLTPVLIFDQFEEVFTLRDDDFRRNFAQEIGELTRGHRTTASAEHGIEVAPEVKFIISLREEYLGSLEEMTAAIPDLFRERLRLVPLSAAEAREAIVEPARLEGNWWSPKFEFDAQCLDSLVDFIGGTSSRIRVIEALTLQLVCQRAEEIAREADTARRALLLDDFGGTSGLEDLVHGYYTSVLNKLDATTRKKVVTLFERGLLDPSGKRLMLEQNEIRRNYGVGEVTLNTLVENRLLRREPRNESVFYEITHDRLTEVIARHRSIRLPPWVHQALLVAAVLIVVLLGSLIFVVKSMRKAETAQRETAQALDVLFGDGLALRLHEVGLSDALDQVLQKAPAPKASEPLSRARALRRQGELAFERATLPDADARFLAADRVIDDAVHDGKGSKELAFEHAQVLKDRGDVLLNKGLVSQANLIYGEALGTLSNFPSNAEDPIWQLSVIEIQTALGSTWSRLGDNDKLDSLLLDATHGALEVLKVAYAQPPDQGGDVSFLLGRAMQVYADVALTRAARLGTDQKLARALAAESVRLRPLSAQARVQLGTASAMRSLDMNVEEAAKARRLLEESQTQFNDITRFDPLNRRMYRESAAVQALTAELAATCVENAACAKWMGPDTLRSAESSALDAVAMFRELSRRDPEDRSYRDDIAWGTRVQARLRSARGDWADALVLIEEALKITRINLADPRDLDNRWAELELLLTKAKVLAASPHREETQGVLDEVISEVRELPESNSRRFVQIQCLHANAEILRKLDREKDAVAADAEADSLKRPEDDARAQQARAQKAHDLNSEGVALIERARAAGGLERRQNYDLAVEKYRAALAQNPGDPIIWSNLGHACSGAVSELVNGDGEVLKPDDTTVVRRGLRCAVESAWMAWVLSRGAGEQKRLAKLSELVVARRSLAKTLRYDDENAVKEALSLARENVREVTALVTKDTSADALFLLADSYYGAGLMSEAAPVPAEGWEEEMRAAIVSGERLRDREPDSSERRLWIGQAGSELADTLEKHGRPDLFHEREHAREACQEAMGLAKTPGDREEAQSCIEGAQKK